MRDSSLPTHDDDVDDTPLNAVKDDVAGAEPRPLNTEGSLDFTKQKEAFEKEFIIKALKAFKGRINQTALHANIPKKTLLRKIEKYGINARDYSES
jgi:DNA-binding NtrC family response regulator